MTGENITINMVFMGVFSKYRKNADQLPKQIYKNWRLAKSYCQKQTFLLNSGHSFVFWPNLLAGLVDP